MRPDRAPRHQLWDFYARYSVILHPRLAGRRCQFQANSPTGGAGTGGRPARTNEHVSGLPLQVKSFFSANQKYTLELHEQALATPG